MVGALCGLRAAANTCGSSSVRARRWVPLNVCLRTGTSGGQGTLKDPAEQTGEVCVCVAADGHITKRLLTSLFGHSLFCDHSLSFFSRVCRRVCPRCHRDSEYSDRRWGCLSEPLGAHIHGLPPAVHLPYAGDHQLQSG